MEYSIDVVGRVFDLKVGKFGWCILGSNPSLWKNIALSAGLELTFLKSKYQKILIPWF